MDPDEGAVGTNVPGHDLGLTCTTSQQPSQYRLCEVDVIGMDELDDRPADEIVSGPGQQVRHRCVHLDQYVGVRAVRLGDGHTHRRVVEGTPEALLRLVTFADVLDLSGVGRWTLESIADDPEVDPDPQHRAVGPEVPHLAYVARKGAALERLEVGGVLEVVGVTNALVGHTDELCGLIVQDTAN